jgi:UDP-hydrolysing UDP-N-acetyl-D-glucosamine 2-epimerase
MKKKICIVVNSRANYARIKTLLYKIKKNKKFTLQLILGASGTLSRFGDLEGIILKDGFKIIRKIYSIVEGENLETMAKSAGLGIIELSSIFSDIKPNFVIVIADRFENMSIAIAASYMNIPLIHTQGGEVTGSIDESVRHAISKLSHIHFPSTKRAYKNLVKMGENPKNIYLTGCPSIDIAKTVEKKRSTINFNKKYFGIGCKINFKEPYLVVIYHPITTEYSLNNQNIKNIIEVIAKINMQTVWLWPNIDAGANHITKTLRTYREKNKIKKIKFFKNFEPEDYLILLKSCRCLIGNSSSAIREGSFLGIPAVNIGNRQQGREHGKNLLNVKGDKQSIYKGIKIQINKNKFKSEKIFGEGDAADKIIRIIKKLNINFNINKILNYDK